MPRSADEETLRHARAMGLKPNADGTRWVLSTEPDDDPESSAPFPPRQSLGTLTYGSGLFPTLGIGTLIAIYQFFNERANFCLALFGTRCDYPPEYLYPVMLILLLFVLSVLYGVWCMVRQEPRHGMGAISGGFFSVVLFFVGMGLGAMASISTG